VSRRALLLALVALAATGPARAASPPFTVTASVERGVVPFADTFVVEATARFDPDTVDAGSVRVELAPGPFDPVGKPTLHSRDGEVTLRQSLACLSEGCVPVGKGPRVARIPAARATAALATGAPLAVESRAVTVRIAPRVTPAQVAARTPPFRRPVEISPPAYRTGAGLLAALAAAAAAVLLLGAALLVVAELRRRRALRPEVPADRLARALRLVRESAFRVPPDRRRALDHLSRTLEDVGDGGHARGATQLAWSPPEPEPAAAHALADAVEAGR
jgi:hypothetical protein